MLSPSCMALLYFWSGLGPIKGQEPPLITHISCEDPGTLQVVLLLPKLSIAGYASLPSLSTLSLVFYCCLVLMHVLVHIHIQVLVLFM